MVAVLDYQTANQPPSFAEGQGMHTETKYLRLTNLEAELLMDTFRVSNPMSRQLALKAAGLVVEWAAEAHVAQAETMLQALDTVPLSGE
jgi:hypothetical protein